MLDPVGAERIAAGMMEGDESVRGTECWRTSRSSRLHEGGIDDRVLDRLH